MTEYRSWGESALDGAERVRAAAPSPRDRICALPLLLRGAYYTEAPHRRALAEEDLRKLYRSGVHDHMAGGFFADSGDAEWLRPMFEKRLGDNALIACCFAEAWESGHMAFYRAAAEGALDFCLRELKGPSGLYFAYQRPAADREDAYLLTPGQIADELGADTGRHFAECYDVTEEGNLGEGRSIPNLILNQRWSLVPEGYAELRGKLCERRIRIGGTVCGAPSFAGSALLLAALAKCGRVFSELRFVEAAQALAAALLAAAAGGDVPRRERACLILGLCELYETDFDPAHLSAAAESADALGPLPDEFVVGAESDRALSLETLGLDRLYLLTGDPARAARRGDALRELCLNAARHGPEALPGLCALLSAGHGGRRLLCLCPDEEAPEELKAVRSRYAPDLALLLKTPGREAALDAVADTAGIKIGNRSRFFTCPEGEWRALSPG